jgi:outer membrane protein TolC
VIRYQVNQSFPIRRKLRARSAAAEASADMIGADVEVVRRSLRVAAVQLFVQALYLQSALETNAKLIETLDDVVASAEARYTTGGASAHHDVLLATAQRAILERDALVLDRELAVLHAQMNELRGLPPERPAPRLVDDGVLDESSLPSRNAAFADQPELKEAQAMVRAADTRVEVARTVGYPDFAVQLMAMQSLTPGMPSGVGAMVGVSVPIFWKTKQGPGIDAAQVDRQSAARRRDALQLRLEAEWHTAERAYRTSLDTLALYENKVLPAIRAALDSSESAYITQQTRLSELLDVMRAALAAELEHAASQLDVRLARLRLEELLASPSVLRLAPSSPTLFGGGMAGSSAGGMDGRGMSSGPVRMGEGIRPPVLDVGDGGMGGMGAMGGMR